MLHYSFCHSTVVVRANQPISQYTPAQPVQSCDEHDGEARVLARLNDAEKAGHDAQETGHVLHHSFCLSFCSGALVTCAKRPEI